MSAYDAQSHRCWHEGMVKNLPYDFYVMTLPARYFNWRIRGNPLTWAMGSRDELLGKHWDLIVATSMVDLATLKGLVPEISSVPCVVYFHENQFSYPLQNIGENLNRASHSIEPQMVTLYSALASNVVLFNSSFNRQSFLSGVDSLLRKFPDEVPLGVVDMLNEKSLVLPVPISEIYFDLSLARSPKSHSCLEIIWNHRWEYDKGPDRLLAIIKQLSELAPNLNLRWHVVGQQFRQVPQAFGEIKNLLTRFGWLGEWGFLPPDQYHRLLQQSDVVLSTALHDFQGLAVMDAVAAGCIPILPNRLAYAEFFESDCLYGSVTDEFCYGDETDSAVKKLIDTANRLSVCVPSLAKLSWKTQAEQYIKVFESLVPAIH